MYLWNAYAGYNYKKYGSIQGTYGKKGNTVSKRLGGTNATADPYDPFSNFGVPASNSSAKFIWVGTGTEAPNISDYTIPNKCAYSTSGINVASVTNGAVEYDENTNTFSKTSVTLIKNAGSEPVTVSEVYIISSATSFGSTGNVWYKKLLDQPITVEPNKYLEIAFTSRVKDGTIIE